MIDKSKEYRENKAVRHLMAKLLAVEKSISNAEGSIEKKLIA